MITGLCFLTYFFEPQAEGFSPPHDALLVPPQADGFSPPQETDFFPPHDDDLLPQAAKFESAMLKTPP